MPSLRSRIVIGLLRHRHLLRGQARRPVVDETTSIDQLRASAERSAARIGGRIEGVRITPVHIGHMSAEWIEPECVTGPGTVLYFHGGGYVMGSLASHRRFVARVARESGLRTLHFGYRLAPEHPHPAALDDALLAFDWLLGQSRVNPAECVFLGDSAGGGLCLAALLALRDRDKPLPAGAATMSAWTDLACTGASHERSDDLASPGSWQRFARCYADATELKHPLVSPLYGELSGLPPLLLCAGTAEAALDDTTRFAERAAADGVAVRLLLGEQMVHCYPVFSPLFPEARAALGEICRFLRKVTSGA